MSDEIVENTMIALIGDPEKVEPRFVDTIAAEANPEALILAFFHTLKTAEDAFERRVILRAAITWPHAARLRDLLGRLIHQHRETIRDAITTSLWEKGQVPGNEVGKE